MSLKLTVTSQISCPIYNIVAPIGGFSNHVRLLMLLDDRFTFTIKNHFDLNTYDIFRGSDWPSYEQYLANDFTDIRPDVVKEIKQKINEVEFGTPDQKLAFIKTYMFPADRTWHNWLHYELRYRDLFYDIIPLEHSFMDLSNKELKSLVCTVDPDLAYKCYLKFNTLLNCITKEEFLVIINKQNDYHKSLNNVPLLDTTGLFTPTLDRKWYEDLINIFGFINYYEDAQFVHSLWYNTHKRSESEFVADITTLYKNI